MRKRYLLTAIPVLIFLYMILPFGGGGIRLRHRGSSAARFTGIHSHQMNQLVSSSKAQENGEIVLLLSPIAKFYPEYWENLLKLTYPKKFIELGFIVPRNAEGDATLKQLDAVIKKHQSQAQAESKYRRVTILRQDTESPDSQKEKVRHALAAQKERRHQMSLARNSLLFTTLGPSTSWVLWLDADVIETPVTLIQDLTSHDKPILVANCFQRYFNEDKKLMDIRPYDYNSWIDSERAKELAQTMGDDDILVEGYPEMATYRTLMAMLYDAEGDPNMELMLDGVGGTALMVKAEVHRDGAMFPPFPFYHLMETEGFAKMASRLGYQSWGLPNYLVYHYDE